jgi:DNA-binding NarL/FixJ family response regulator
MEDQLTPREIEVLKLIASGQSGKQIAAKLGIAFRTARSHRSNLMEKLDVHDTASLVRYAIRTGLIQA